MQMEVTTQTFCLGPESQRVACCLFLAQLCSALFLHRAQESGSHCLLGFFAGRFAWAFAPLAAVPFLAFGFGCAAFPFAFGFAARLSVPLQAQLLLHFSWEPPGQPRLCPRGSLGRSGDLLQCAAPWAAESSAVGSSLGDLGQVSSLQFGSKNSLRRQAQHEPRYVGRGAACRCARFSRFWG